MPEDQDGAAIDAVKETVDEFAPELTALGQDEASIKSRVDALESRMLVVEAKLGIAPPVPSPTVPDPEPAGGE